MAVASHEALSPSTDRRPERFLAHRLCFRLSKPAEGTQVVVLNIFPLSMSCPHSLWPTSRATLLPRDRFNSLPAPALPFGLAQDELPLFPRDLVQLVVRQGLLSERESRRAPERRQLAAVPVHIVLVLQPVPPRVAS